MIAVAGLSIRQGRRVFPTVKPVSRTAGAKTQPSGRAASRVAATEHRWPNWYQSAFNGDPPPGGGDRWGGAAAGPARGLARRRRLPTCLAKFAGWLAVTSKTHRNRLATSKDQWHCPATLMPYFQSEGRVTIGPSNPPPPYGRGCSGNLPGEAKRRRHGMSGMPLMKTRPVHRRSTRIVSNLTVPFLSNPTPGMPQSDSL